jgi:Fic family protein
MQLAVEEATAATAIAPEHIVEIHQVLMADAPNKHVAGQIRQEQNWIGGNDYNPCGAAFVPPPHEEVTTLLVDLCELLNSEHLPPLVQAAIAHAQFETIHPFMDGNGRTGRALIHVVLRKRQLAPAYVPPVSVILARRKDGYIAGLTDFRDGPVAGWLEHFAAAAAQSATLAERYLIRVRSMQDRWREQLAGTVSPRADAAAWAIIDQLPAFAVITVPVAVAATARTKPAVNAALHQLEHAGVVTPLGQSKRNRAWEATGLLDLLAGLDAGE